MEDLISYFKVKKNLVNLLVLAILVAGLPIAIQLARQQQIIKSYAKEAVVEFLAGQCVTNRGNNLVATCKDPINVRITAPFSPAGVGSQSSKVTSVKGLMSLVPKGGLVGTVYADKCNPDDDDYAPDCECDDSCEPPPSCEETNTCPPPDCEEDCTGEQCGQDDGCGGSCSDADTDTPGMCGNLGECTNICDNYASDECGNLTEPPSDCDEGNVTCTVGSVTGEVGYTHYFCVTPRENCPENPAIGVGADFTCQESGKFENPTDPRCDDRCSAPEGSCPAGSSKVTTLDPTGEGDYIKSLTIVSPSLQPYTAADLAAGRDCGYAYFTDTTDYSSSVRYCASDSLKFGAWSDQAECKDQALNTGGKCTGTPVAVGTCTSANQCGPGTQAYQYTTLSGSTCTKAEAPPQTCTKKCTTGTCGADNKCSGSSSPSPSGSSQGQTHVFVEAEDGGSIKTGSKVIVTATGSTSCSQNITTPPTVNANGYSGCSVNPKSFICNGTGDRANPKNNDACWWEWTCTVSNTARNYNISFNAGGNKCQSSVAMNVTAPSPSPSPSAAPITTTEFRWAENPADLEKAAWQAYTKDQQLVTVKFADDTAGKKSIWVEFKFSNGTTQTKISYIDLVDPDPKLSGLDCNLDSTGAVHIKVKGNNFGKNQGTSRLSINNTSVNIEDWKDATISAKLATAATGSNKYTVTLNRGDQAPAITETCTVGVSQITLGTKLFCRSKLQTTLNDVEVTLVEDIKGAKPIKEEVTIDKDGVIQGLKTKIQEGKKYKLGIKVPRSLRKVVSFTGTSGTTVIPDLNLPIGDISPADGDGIVNNADRHELIRQWRLIPGSGTRPCDFNGDGLCNSFDWACSLSSFNKPEDPEPTGTGSSTASPSPSPSPSPAPSASP